MTTSRSESRRTGVGRVVVMALLVGLGGLSACRATVRLVTEPDGAVLSWTDPDTGLLRRASSPASLDVALGRPLPVTIEADGYRPLTVDLRRTEGRPLRFIEGQVWTPRGREVTVLLQPLP